MMKILAAVLLLGFLASTDGNLLRHRAICALNCAYDTETGCFRLPNGLYQSCQDCNRYVRCAEEALVERGACSAGWWFSTSAQACSPPDPVNACCGCDCTNPYTTPVPTPAPTTTRAPTPVRTSTPAPTPTPTDVATDPPTESPKPPVDTCTTTGRYCITAAAASCSGLPDGDYQACEGCTFYHSCVAGYLNYAYRPCPLTDYGGISGKLVWQRKAASVYNEGTCERSSWSCTECDDDVPVPPPTEVPTRVPPTPPPQPDQCFNTGSGCISAAPSSCSGLPDGDYQACEGCTYYHSCVAGYLNYAYRDCPLTNYGGLRGRLVWQRKAGVYNVGTCEYSSTTCEECITSPTDPPPTQTPVPPTPPPTKTPVPPTPPPTQSDKCYNTGSGCISASASACNGLPDGDYQACEGCTYYHSCVAGYLNYAYRPCPLTNYLGLRGRLVWQRKAGVYNVGTCEYSSTTCTECISVPPAPVTTGTPRPDPSTATAPPSPDNDQPCAPIVGTGTGTGYGCISAAARSCSGLSDGDYQACEGCTYYHSCVAGYLNYAFRPCPLTNYLGLRGRLVWQRKAGVYNEGTCEYISTTCKECEANTVPARTTPATAAPAPTTAVPDPRPCSSTGRNCIPNDVNSCKGLPDGDYQACEDCTTFYKCSNGYIYKFDCPLTNYGGLRGKLIWQQWDTPNTGRCERESSSCKECDQIYPRPPTEPSTPNTPAPTIIPSTTPADNEIDWTPCRSTGSGCIAAFAGACQGRADGNYQACEGCTIYHSCSGGVLYASRLCARTFVQGLRGRLVWKQLSFNQGICDYTSPTCKECADDVPAPTVPPTCPAFPRCVHSFTNCLEDGLPDGDYQICQSCFHYLSCRGGKTWPCRPCPSYNDRPWQWRITSPTQGYCTNSSDTCNQCPYLRSKNTREAFELESRFLRALAMKRKSRTSCITGASDSCQGLVSGDYQACESCSVYHSCSGGVIFANRPCPAGLVWEATGPRQGYCSYTSTTCTGAKKTSRNTVVKAAASCIRGDNNACENLVSGDYQACEGCTFYHSCSGGLIYPRRDCPGDLVWQSSSPNSGYCTYASSSCGGK